MNVVNARNKGARLELNVMHLFIDNGWEFAGTSRNNNRALDAMKIDLVETEPFRIQCKNTNTSMNYWKYIENNPQVNTIIHHRTDKRAELWVMTRELVEKLLKNYNSD